MVKPYIEQEEGHFVSISHSADLVVVMISESEERGVDVELIRPKILRIAHKFIHVEEAWADKNDTTQLTLILVSKGSFIQALLAMV
jgi:4'-phosphopantetheinyl transferase